MDLVGGSITADNTKVEKLDVVVQPCDPGTWEMNGEDQEFKVSLPFRGQYLLRLHETQSQKKLTYLPANQSNKGHWNLMSL